MVQAGPCCSLAHHNVVYSLWEGQAHDDCELQRDTLYLISPGVSTLPHACDALSFCVLDVILKVFDDILSDVALLHLQ